ncbi:MAG: hypothetical protein H3C41_11870 [Bacteroidales bacterium]|nr:hypothetical protein [Bacteroidales bacterium]
MRRSLFFLLGFLFFLNFRVEAQKSRPESILALAENLMQQYSTSKKRFEAAYQWVTHYIRYDAMQAQGNPAKRSQSEVTIQAFRSGKAVCEGYAGVLDSLAKLMGIPSHLVCGYTRLHGQTDPTPHVWVASLIDGHWLLSDPTFGSGSMENGKFVFEYKPAYLMMSPEKAIETHIPYDPLWQFLASPQTHEGFYKNDKNRCIPGYYLHHHDSLMAFFGLDDEQRLRTELDRIMQQPHYFEALKQRMAFLENSIQLSSYNRSVRQIQQIQAIYNQAVGAYNIYVKEFNAKTDGRSGKAKTDELEKARLLVDSCEMLLLNSRFHPQTIESAQKVQQAIFEFQQKIREAY